MASEHQDQDARYSSYNRPLPISDVGEASSGVQLQGSTGAGGQQSGESPTREERGSPLARNSAIPSRDSPRPQGQQVLAHATPSDLENGQGGMPAPTRVIRQRDSGMALPPLPAEHDQSDGRYNTQRTPRSQRSDPFAGSADGGSPVAQANHGLLRRSQHESPTSANNSPYEERDGRVDQGAGGVRPNNGTQGRDNQEGFGAHLRHAAADYLHEALPFHHVPPPRARLTPDGTRRSGRRNGTGETGVSVIDHIVPTLQHNIPEPVYIEKLPPMPGSVSARLSATLHHANSERDKYASKAKFTGLALNVAIGLQVLLGSLTTGLSAVATRGKSAAVATTILGALATVVASYLARARGSNEPELSITRVKDLEQFIRECTNFETDHGDDTTSKYNDQIETFRMRFESLLGNANGERRLSPTGGAF